MTTTIKDAVNLRRLIGTMTQKLNNTIPEPPSKLLTDDVAELGAVLTVNIVAVGFWPDAI